MSTAFGHGLADPKSRGKPVSHANEGRCSRQRGSLGLFWSNPGGLFGLSLLGLDTHHTRVERASGQYSGASRVDRVSLPVVDGSLLWLPGQPGGWGGGSQAAGSKWHSYGGDAKPTFGTPSVTLGRDLFSS